MLRKTQDGSSLYQDSIGLIVVAVVVSVSSTLEKWNIKHGLCQFTPTTNMTSASAYSQLISVENSSTTIFLQILC